MLAPFGTPKVQLGIVKEGLAMRTSASGIVLPEFNHLPTGGTGLFKDVFWFPKPLILARAVWHGWLSLRYRTLGLCGTPECNRAGWHSGVPSTNTSTLL